MVTRHQYHQKSRTVSNREWPENSPTAKTLWTNEIHPHKAFPLVCAADHVQTFMVWSLGPSPLLLVKARKNRQTIALQWPSMSTRVLIRKLNFLCHLLSNSNNAELISKEIFVSLASVDVYSISIMQQCCRLESSLGTSVLARCLNEPSEALIHSNREQIESDQ